MASTRLLEETATADEDTSDSPDVAHHDIARRAYDLYLERGSTDGHHDEDWFRAEGELRELAAGLKRIPHISGRFTR